MLESPHRVCVDSFLNPAAFEDADLKVPDTSTQNTGEKELVAQLPSLLRSPELLSVTGCEGSPEIVKPATPPCRRLAPLKACAGGPCSLATGAWVPLPGDLIEIPGVESPPMPQKLDATTQHPALPEKAIGQSVPSPRFMKAAAHPDKRQHSDLPSPRLLKGLPSGGTRQTEDQHHHRGPPRFLKGGQRHSTHSQPSWDSAASATEDEDDLYADKHDELDTAVAELHADVGKLHADMPGRPHHWRHRKRMRRHENGYNEAAQIKALECGAAQPGWRVEGWYRSGISSKTGMPYGRYVHTYYPPLGFKAFNKELQKASYHSQADICKAMGIGTPMCRRCPSQERQHDPALGSNAGAEEQDTQVEISDTEEEDFADGNHAIPDA